MASSKEYLDFIMEQLSGLEGITYRAMMGGYIFYYRERIFGGIYGAGFMVKITEASRKYMPDSIACPPYDGAKEMLPVTIIDDRELLQKMVSEMFRELPERKPTPESLTKNKFRNRTQPVRICRGNLNEKCCYICSW